MNRLMLPVWCLGLLLGAAALCSAQNSTQASSPATSQEALVVWAGQISQQIKEHWRVPAGLAPVEGPVRVTRIKLQFDTNGTMTSYALTRSSGLPGYDDAALRAVALGGREHIFGPPPSGESLSFSIDFNSKEQPR